MEKKYRESWEYPKDTYRLRMCQRVFHRKGHTSEWDEFIKGL